MSITDKLTFDDFVFLIKNNKKLNDFGEVEIKGRKLKKSIHDPIYSSKNLPIDIEEDIKDNKDDINDDDWINEYYYYLYI